MVRKDDQTDISTALFVVVTKSSKDCREELCQASEGGSATELLDLAVARVDAYFDTSAELETKKRLALAHQTMTGMLTLEHRSGPAGKRPWLGSGYLLGYRKGLLDLGYRECLQKPCCRQCLDCRWTELFSSSTLGSSI